MAIASVPADVTMRYVTFTLIVVLALPYAHSADVRGYGVLTSDYVFRGVTYSDGDPAAQLGVDVGFDSGLYFGVWGSTIDIYNGADRQRDFQVNYYIGYLVDATDDWAFGAHFVSYTFPRATGNVDYDYEEWSVVANFADTAWLEYSWSPDLYHSGYDSHTIDLLIERPLARDWILGAGGGYYDVSRLSGAGYGYWQAGVSRTFGEVDVDIRYHDTNRDVPIISTPDRADARVAISLRLQF